MEEEWGGARWTAAIILACHWLTSLLLWPQVAGSMGGDWWIDADGAGWIRSGAVSWFALPVVSLGLLLTTWWVARRLSRNPLFMGIRAMGWFRRLGSPARERVLSRQRDALESGGLPVVLIFLLVQVGMYQALVGRSSLPWIFAGLILSILAFSFLPGFLQRRMDRVVAREWLDAGSN